MGFEFDAPINSAEKPFYDAAGGPDISDDKHPLSQEERAQLEAKNNGYRSVDNDYDDLSMK